MPKSRRNVYRRSNNRKNRKSLKRQHGRKHFRKMTGGGLNEKYGRDDKIKPKLLAKHVSLFKYNTPQQNENIVENTLKVLKTTNTWDDYDINNIFPKMNVSHVIEALIDDVNEQNMAKESLSSFKKEAHKMMEKLENDKKKQDELEKLKNDKKKQDELEKLKKEQDELEKLKKEQDELEKLKKGEITSLSHADYKKFIDPWYKGDNTFLHDLSWIWNLREGVYIYTPPSSFGSNGNLDNGAGGGNSGAGGIHVGHFIDRYAHERPGQGQH